MDSMEINYAALRLFKSFIDSLFLFSLYIYEVSIHRR